MRYFLFLFLVVHMFFTGWCQSSMVNTDSTKPTTPGNNHTLVLNQYRQALEKAILDREGELVQANLNDSIGKYAMLLEDYKLAETFLSTGLSLHEKLSGTETREYAFTATCLGQCYATLAVFDKAIPLLEKAFAVRKSVYGMDHLDYAITANYLGMAYFRIARYGEAESLLLEARNIRKQKLGVQHPDYLVTTVDLGNIYLATKKNKDALDMYTEARNEFIKSGNIDNNVYTRATLNSGAIYFNSGQLNIAQPLFEETNRLLRKNNIRNPVQRGYTNYYLGFLYSMLTRQSEAREFLEEAKEIAVQSLTKNHPVYYLSLIALGQFLVGTAQFDKAEENLLEARQIVNRLLGKNNSNYALTSKGLAQLYFNQGKHDQARPYVEESLELSRQISGEESLDYADACIVNGIFYFNTREFSKAETYTIKAIEIFEKLNGKNNRNYSECNYFLGRLYVRMQKYNEAEKYLLEAKHWAEQGLLGTNNRMYGEICEQLAVTYWYKNDRKKAIEYFSLGYDILQETRKKYFLGSSESEQNTYAWRVNRFVNTYFSFISSMPDISDGELAYRFTLCQRNTILNSSRQLKQLISSVKDPSLQAKYNEWLSTREELARMTSHTTKDSVNILAKKAFQQEEVLARLSGEFRKVNREEVNWTDIQSKLKTNEAAIEFVSFRYEDWHSRVDSVLVAAIILKATGSPQVVTLCSNSAITNLLKQRGASKEVGINSLYTNQKLAEMIWMPLEKNLEGIKKVYYSLSGILNRISLAALPLPDNQLLSEKYRLEQLLSTASITQPGDEKLESGNRIVAYGGVAFQADTISLIKAAQLYHKQGVTRSLSSAFNSEGDFNQFPPLPYSEIEIRNIEKATKGTGIDLKTFSGVSANEESVKALNGEASPTILHFATHGFFFNEPAHHSNDAPQTGLFRYSENPLLRSGLILAGAENTWKGKTTPGIEDGVLTSYEVAGLYLPNTKLVVLSACETGAGDLANYEGVLGLQRAFKISGVEYMVMSLWELSDVAASEFMQEFYQQLLRHSTVRDAFYHAQTKMKIKYRKRPYLWAGFILTR